MGCNLSASVNHSSALSAIRLSAPVRLSPAKALSLTILTFLIFSFPLKPEEQRFPPSKPVSPVSIIPHPHWLKIKKGFFRWNSRTPVIIEGAWSAEPLSAYLAPALEKRSVLLSPPLLNPSSRETKDRNAVFLVLKKKSLSAGNFPDESYTLRVTPREIRIKARHPAGLFYAVQTLRQIVLSCAPPGNEPGNGDGILVPCLAIHDKPLFPWRGMHLDVSRHFMDKDTVMRFIDRIALYKFNRFHWHLTDDQGWRVPIRSHPRLTEIGAWREESNGEIHGGFYSPEDISKILAHAAQRHIMVIPEIDIPGHTTALLAAYPEYSCTGGPFKTTNQWGVHPDVLCPGEEKTFAFLEEVIQEIIALFPAPYIHIGGDECPTDRWKECPKCRQRMTENHFTDPVQLHGYFIRRIAAFLEKRGRIPIGWDEIEEGGAPVNAVVQYWRNMEGASASMRAGRAVIASPSDFTYLNHTVRDLSLRTAYSFQPLPENLSRREKKRLLGGEGCLWSEHITAETLEKQAFPRALALAEVFWSRPKDRDFQAFHRRLGEHYRHFNEFNISYGPEARPITISPEFDPTGPTWRLTLETGAPELQIRYTLDGSPVTPQSSPYTGNLKITSPLVLTAAAFVGDKPCGEPEKMIFLRHAAVGKQISLQEPYSPQYPAGGAYALCDGLTGSADFHDGLWQGFEGVDLRAVIDLGASRTVHFMEIVFLHAPHSWIFLPESVLFEISPDGVHYQKVGIFTPKTPENQPEIAREAFRAAIDGAGDPTAERSIRFIRVSAVSRKVNPSWHYAPGQPCWLFADEIIVN